MLHPVNGAPTTFGLGRVHLPRLLVVGLAVLSCGEAPNEDCLLSHRQAIVGAGVPSLLAETQQAAVGMLRVPVAENPNFAVCSATWLGGAWVLTAAHCAHADLLEFHTNLPSESDSLYTIDCVESLRFVHPELDAMLIRVTSSELLTLHLEPLSLMQLVDESWVGREVTLAGWGEDAYGVRGDRRYATQPIVDLSSTTFTVDGRGVSGACAGDSGGPALGVDANGRAQVLGILSFGSADCVGRDTYVRADVLVDWIDEVVRKGNATACSELDRVGRCDGDVARWCELGEPTAELCVASQVCGYDSSEGGYRCVAEPTCRW